MDSDMADYYPAQVRVFDGRDWWREPDPIDEPDPIEWSEPGGGAEDVTERTARRGTRQLSTRLRS
jgi:hypothetical protein